MKILVIGAMHGNEPLGTAVVKWFEKNPVVGVGTLVANKRALVTDCRFVKNDLNRSFPGKIKSGDYEIKRAAQILLLCKKYDLVLDFHNTYCPDNDCTFVGETANKSLLLVSQTLGLTRVIVADYNCINKYAPNCISVEISLTSKRNSAKLWYDKIKSLSTANFKSTPAKVEKYKFVYRITNEDRDRLNLRSKNLKAFKKIPLKISKAMGIDGRAFGIFIGDGYTPYNFGGLLKKLN